MPTTTLIGVRQRRRRRNRSRSLLRLLLFPMLACLFAHAEQVPVRHREGLIHGFLVMRTLDGEIVADGDLVQNARGDRVTSRLVFHFKDGSLQDETAVFSQHGSFRLISDHLVQKGPSFDHPLDMNLNAANGQVVVHYSEKGEDKTAAERLKVSPDIANGIILCLLKNLRPDAGEIRVAYLAATPKPRLVQLAVSSEGKEDFSTGGERRKATRYVVKVDIGGLTGVLASMFAKKPPDTRVWILEGEAPAFVKSEGPLGIDGSIRRIELVSPVWPHAAASKEKDKRQD